MPAAPGPRPATPAPRASADRAAIRHGGKVATNRPRRKPRPHRRAGPLTGRGPAGCPWSDRGLADWHSTPPPTGWVPACSPDPRGVVGPPAPVGPRLVAQRPVCPECQLGKRRETGMEKEMKELYTEGLATHGGPESCVGDPRGRSEALTGVRAGGAIEPRKHSPGCRRPPTRRKATPQETTSRVACRPRAVGEPRHARNLHAREPGDPVLARTASGDAPSRTDRGVAGRGRAGVGGNAKAVRPR